MRNIRELQTKKMQLNSIRVGFCTGLAVALLGTLFVHVRYSDAKPPHHRHP